MYKNVLRKILFLFPPELVHNFVVSLLKFHLFSKLLKLFYHFDHPSLRRNYFGLSFPNPLGMAAGFDKNAEIIPQAEDLGFGFIEIGTVTPKAQEGNPKPRIFRLPEDEALINRMGFNNHGVEKAVQQLQKYQGRMIVAGNIGKNKLTSIEKAVSDYEKCFEALYNHVHFFIVNVSSPNTPGLRELQNKEPLIQLLSRLKKLNQEKPYEKPIFLKIAPDLNDSQLEDIVEIIQKTSIAGVVATNTTTTRDHLKTNPITVNKLGEGGLSGKPLRERSTEIIKFLRKRLDDNFIIIGVGGIHSVQDALEKFKAGASLIELYTGFIYEGPTLIRNIKKNLVNYSSS
jgi:dihydroorotate dehydrogenase